MSFVCVFCRLAHSEATECAIVYHTASPSLRLTHMHKEYLHINTHTWDPSVQLGMPCRSWLGGFVPLSGGHLSTLVAKIKSAQALTFGDVLWSSSSATKGASEGCGRWGVEGDQPDKWAVIGGANNLITERLLNSKWLQAYLCFTPKKIYQNQASKRHIGGHRQHKQRLKMLKRC